MSRKVISLSLNQELLNQFEDMAAKYHKSHSELFRELIIERLRKPVSGDNELKDSVIRLIGDSVNQTIVVGLAIIRRGGKMLIVSRKHQDKLIEQLHWSFPGGRLFTLGMGNELSDTLNERLGAKVALGNVIGARVIPETLGAEQQVIAVYFEAVIDTERIKLNQEYYTDSKWVDPQEVYKYFTTSTSDEISRYLSFLHNS